MEWYTPDVSEFYVGFECEVNASYNSDITSFVPVVLGKDFFDLVYFKDKIQARVKILDQKDLEEIGFKYDDTNCYISKNGNYHLRTWLPNTEQIYLRFKQGDDWVNPIVLWNIKNKSEAVKIFKTLGLRL